MGVFRDHPERIWDLGAQPGGDQESEVAKPLSSEETAARREAENQFRFGSFLDAVGERAFGQFGSTLQKNFNPLDAASNLAGITSNLPTQVSSDQPMSARDFFGDSGDGAGSRATRGNEVAANTLRALFGGNIREGTVSGPDGGPDMLVKDRAAQFSSATGGLDQGTEQGQQDLSTLRRLGRGAATNQRGSFVGGNLLPSQSRVNARLQQLLASGGFGVGENQNSNDFIRQQFGLNF